MVGCDSDIEQRLRELLASAPPEYLCAYLFGSQARGDARPESDIDLAFWRQIPSSSLEDQPYLYADLLSHALGKRVELVELNHAPPDLVHEVLRDGKLVLDRESDARIAFEVRARQRYLDLRPFLLRYRGLPAEP